MSSLSNYVPGDAAILSDTLYTALLAERDLGLRIPINFRTNAGVALTAACFSDGEYDDGPAQKCFSNLLSAGFSRFVLDLYWDASRETWSLCPVELNEGSMNDTSTSLSTSSSSTSARASISSAALTIRDVKQPALTEALLSAPGFITRGSTLRSQRDATPTADVTGYVDSLPISTASSQPSISQDFDAECETLAQEQARSPSYSTLSPRDSLVHVGPYSCSPAIGLTNFTTTLAEFFHESENSVNATFKYLFIDLHAAAPHDNPTGDPKAPSSSSLPSTGNYVSELLNTSLSSYIYTPSALAHQRTNVNLTWFGVDEDYQPLASYLQLEIREDGDLYTENGWPSESYLELQRALRFVVGYRTIDPQLSDYDVAQDADTIFPIGELYQNRTVTINAEGNVTSGCLFVANDTSHISPNASWATSSELAAAVNTNYTSYSAQNLTSCGISPILNETLSTGAVSNASIYTAYIEDSIWSWNRGEPRSDADDDTIHCAVLNTKQYGMWQVEDCSDNHYGACRVAESPYNWTISSVATRYDHMDTACGDDSFSVPRTALENTYLMSAIAEWRERNDDNQGTLFWLNFNDINVNGCWVNGVNSTCPYVESDKRNTRTVVVPTVAAIIVFVLAMLTIFVKCAANRQNSQRKRRRGERGWEYEGVPS